MEDGHPWSSGHFVTDDVSEEVQRTLVHSYLLHHCYGETAQALWDAASGGLMTGSSAMETDARDGIGENEDSGIAAVNTRLPIIQAVLNGEVATAIGMATELEPEIFTKRRDVLLDLLCLQFVDIVRTGDTQEAIVFAKKELAPFGYGDAGNVERLEECLALLAYTEPESSPVGQYLREEFRTAVADALNGALLQAANLPDRAPLERVVQQLTATRAALAKDGVTQRFRFGDWVSTPTR